MFILKSYLKYHPFAMCVQVQVRMFSYACE